MREALLPVITFGKISIRRAFRDKTAVFFIFLFPLIFLFIFGGIFGKNDGNVSFRVALINQSSTDFARDYVDQAKKEKVLKLDDKVTTLDQANEKMKRGQLDATIILPAEFGQAATGKTPTGEAKVIYTQNSEQAAGTLISVLQEQFKGINAKFVKIDEPFKVSGQKSNEKSLKAFDYVFAGLLGFSIIGLGIFGPVNVFPELKKQGVLKRLQTTPLRVWQYFLANVISQAVVGILSIVVMFVAARVFFHFKPIGNLLELAVFIVLGIVCIFGIGLAIGGWAKNERQAAPLANLVVFPLMFLSGTFFPRFLMPDLLQKISEFLPLTPVIDGIRLIATEGKHLVDLGPQLGLIFAWIIVIYAIAFRVFRWE
jgi:ABC-2 type transport system permease protein